jgi:hypothetical protein
LNKILKENNLPTWTIEEFIARFMNQFEKFLPMLIEGSTFLTEVENLPQLEANTSSNATHYFVRGQELLLNAPAAFPMIVNYGTRITYEADSNVTISDLVNGEITFTNPNLLPGPALY